MASNNSSTKLGRPQIDEMKKDIAGLLDYGVRFIKCPLTPDEMGEFWHAGFPDKLLDAYTVMAEHGIGVEYHACSSSVGFAIPNAADKAMTVRMTITGGQGGFINITRTMAAEMDKVTIIGVGAEEAWPVISQEECEKRLGTAKWQAFWQWAQDADRMSREIANALDVAIEVLDMISTAGQLERMIPEMVRFLAPEHQAALTSQKRASQLPAEWAGYDKTKVDEALITMGKCDLIKGSVDPDTQSYHFGGEGFSWAVMRDTK